jgi:hypothetical protein
MNDCPNGYVRDLLPDLLHDRLAPAERRSVQIHVDGCVDCRAELVLLGELWATMHRVHAVNVAVIAAALPAYRAGTKPVRRSWVGWRTAAAITMVVAGGTSVALVSRGVGGSSDSLAARSTAAIGAANATSSIANGEKASTPVAAEAPTGGRELAMAGGSLGELSDRELSTLLDGIESLDALPSTDVDGMTAASPVAPAQVKP